MAMAPGTGAAKAHGTAGEDIRDVEWARQPDWIRAWDHAVSLIGTDVRPDYIERGADDLERSVIRRYLEPLEFDCPLHYDRNAAREAGFDDIIAPYSGYQTWTSPALWEPGEAAYYTTDNRDAQPTFREHPFPRLGPATTAMVATDIETEFFEPFLLNDRPYKQGSVLVNCTPKETSVGRGAFVTWQSDLRSRDHRLLGQTRTSLLYYVPRSFYEEERANDA